MMLPNQQTLLDVIATSFFYAYPHIEGQLHYPKFEGLHCYEVPNSSNQWSNFIGAARLSPENADEIIQQVYDYFAGNNRSFGWMLDSSATPADLAKRLQKLGMKKASSYAGMALFAMDTPIKKNPEITIRKAGHDDIDDIITLMDEAFGSGSSNGDLYEYSLSRDDHFFLMAYVEGVKNAVALGRMYYYPDTDIAVMQDAVTTAAYRGRGIYSTLMAKRLEVAKNDAKLVAVMQADRKTSQPICARMGFQEISNLDFYIWLAS